MQEDSILTLKQQLENKLTNFNIVDIKDYDNVTASCKKCSNIKTFQSWNVIGRENKEGNVCYNCYNTDYKMLIEELIRTKAPTFAVIDVSNKTNIQLVCNVCSSMVTASSHNIKNNKTVLCPCCTQTKRAELVVSSGNVPIDVNSSVMLVQCGNTSCNTKFTSRYDRLVRGVISCPKCTDSLSGGAKLIKNFLEVNNIQYALEFKLPNVGRFVDFYLPDHNTFIEFDGEQHFKPVSIWGGEEAFKKIRFSDMYKNEYAISNNVSMLRISYSEAQNINTILKDFLSNTILVQFICIGVEYIGQQRVIGYNVLKTSEISKVRDSILYKNNNICEVTGLPIDTNRREAHLDHKHKKNKQSSIGDEYQGLVRGVLHRDANVFLGKIENSFRRVGLESTGLHLPDLLRSYADYLDKNPYYDILDNGDLVTYIYSTELPKPKKMTKTCYTKLVKVLKEANYSKKIPVYPISGTLTKGLQELFKEYKVEVEYYK